MPRGLKAWRADGIIARISTPRLARQLRRLHLPVVDLYEQGLWGGSRRVVGDDRTVVRLAVDHLRACGFRHFAYTGFPHMAFSQARGRSFAEYVENRGFEPHCFTFPSVGKPRGLAAVESAIARRWDPLARWLCELPKPAGLVACNDILAQQILLICNERGIDVPDMLGVIGVDNDEVRCNLSNPSLSSVDPNAYRIGYEAAALLQRMIQGRLAPREVIVEPAGVVARRSTDVLAFADPEISETVRYIRDHACEGLKLSAVLRHAKVSRATLDRQFIKYLGRTARAEMTRVRVEQARKLLAMTDLPLKQVARRLGFAHVETLHRLLRRATDQTPTEYRRLACRGGSRAAP
jgi:LacI family transcriptional regulator